MSECDGICGKIVFCSNCPKYPAWVKDIESSYVKPRKPVNDAVKARRIENGKRLGQMVKDRSQYKKKAI